MTKILVYTINNAFIMQKSINFGNNCISEV